MALIPKLVHVTYTTKESVPEHWQESIEAWRQFGWIVFFHSDEDNDHLVSTYYPHLSAKYNAFRYKIQKVDLVRLCYLDRWGGVYADLDLVPTEDLYGALQYPCTLVKNPFGHVYYTNMFMAGVPHHPFWKFYMDCISVNAPWWALGKHLHVMTTTGPMKMSESVNTFAGDYHVLPNTWIQNSVCNLYEPLDVKLRATKGQSWNGWDSHMYNFCICNYVVLQMIIAIVLFILLCLLWK